MNFVVIVNVANMIEKDSLLLETVGSIDELQSILELIGFEEEIIDDLSQIMGELVCDVRFKKYDLRIRQMEKEIKKMPKIDKFLKFKGKKALELNWARTVCRRVERKAVAFNRQKKINENVLNYLNRLSSYLFLKAIKQIKK